MISFATNRDPREWRNNFEKFMDQVSRTPSPVNASSRTLLNITQLNVSIDSRQSQKRDGQDLR